MINSIALTLLVSFKHVKFMEIIFSRVIFRFHRVSPSKFSSFPLFYMISIKIHRINKFLVALGIELVRFLLLLLLLKEPSFDRLLACLLTPYSSLRHSAQCTHHKQMNQIACMSHLTKCTGLCSVQNVRCSFNGNIKVPISTLPMLGLFIPHNRATIALPLLPTSFTYDLPFKNSLNRVPIKLETCIFAWTVPRCARPFLKLTTFCWIHMTIEKWKRERMSPVNSGCCH